MTRISNKKGILVHNSKNKYKFILIVTKKKCIKNIQKTYKKVNHKKY